MFNIAVQKKSLTNIGAWFEGLPLEKIIAGLAFACAVVALAWSYWHGYVVVYGDSESHLNIAKRVVDSITPGFAQLGGIWLPLPHLLMVPFVYFDFMWRSGLAGSVVSGTAFVIATIYLYRLALFVSKSKLMAFAASVVFLTNPNILYVQTTPMTEMLLIMFFILSTYHFVRFIEDQDNIAALVAAAIFTFLATLSRYDGWFLAGMQVGVIGLIYMPWGRLRKGVRSTLGFFKTDEWKNLEGRLIMFGVLAFFGVGLWLLWDGLILGDPLYFTHSVFSAKSQQNEWLARGALPSYQNPWSSFLYYTVTAMSTSGVLIFLLAIAGCVTFIKQSSNKHRYYILLILLVPYIFNIVTLFMGQSVIFIPHLTPVGFEWRLFNVRYGVMSVPLVAFCVGYLFYRARWVVRLLVVGLCFAQIGLYVIGYSKVIVLEDGLRGLSSAVAEQPDAQQWITTNYDGGLFLQDDYARTVSVIRAGVPMENTIYIGNKPYWEESLREPEKYARWIVMQKNDAIWTNIYDKPDVQGRLYKYFVKVYTSPDILIFKRNEAVPAGQ